MGEDSKPRMLFRAVGVVKSVVTGKYVDIIGINGLPDYGFASGINISTTPTTITLNDPLVAGSVFYCETLDITNNDTAAHTVSILDGTTVLLTYIIAAGTTVHLDYSSAGIPFSTAVVAYADAASVVDVSIHGILAS